MTRAFRRFRWTRFLVGWVFEHMSFALPVKRLRETDTLLAFYHPSPSYPVHILLVPKRSIASLDQLDVSANEFCRRFLADVVICAQSLAVELNLSRVGYRLLVNGGAYQDFPQLHYHLISGEASVRAPAHTG